MRVFQKFLGLACSVSVICAALGASAFDHVARSGYMIVQDDETVPLPPSPAEAPVPAEAENAAPAQPPAAEPPATIPADPKPEPSPSDLPTTQEPATPKPEPSPSDLPTTQEPATPKPEPSPSDLPVPPEPPASEPVAPTPETAEPAVPEPEVPSVADMLDEATKDEGTKGLSSKGCNVKGCSNCGNYACNCLGTPWKLPQPCGLQRMGIGIGGWIQQGITGTAHRPTDNFNGPVATNDMNGEYQLNQLWLYLHRPADTGGCGWAIGGHVDMMLGTDWRFGINHGLEDRINGFNYQTYGMVLPQAYLELAYNNLSVKLGHFAAILDYEMIPAPRNPFFSHSYSYGYTVPQLVTGALADWKLSDQFSVQAGLHRGWSMFEDFNDYLDVMAGFKWANCDNTTSLNYAFSAGRQSYLPVANYNAGDRFVHSLVFQQQVTERLRYVLVQNLGLEKDTLGGGDAEWYGLNNYLLYTINPCLSANLRAEWMRDDDGVRIAGPGNIPGVDAWNGTGYAGNFYGLTAGVKWLPHPNVMVRPEIRYDKYDGATSPIPGKGALPFGGGGRDDQLSFGTDIVINF